MGASAAVPRRAVPTHMAVSRQTGDDSNPADIGMSSEYSAYAKTISM
jgi:hypothetical protein